jgi:hypothetical protein
MVCEIAFHAVMYVKRKVLYVERSPLSFLITDRSHMQNTHAECYQQQGDRGRCLYSRLGRGLQVSLLAAAGPERQAALCLQGHGRQGGQDVRLLVRRRRRRPRGQVETRRSSGSKSQRCFFLSFSFLRLEEEEREEKVLSSSFPVSCAPPSPLCPFLPVHFYFHTCMHELETACSTPIFPFNFQFSPLFCFILFFSNCIAEDLNQERLSFYYISRSAPSFFPFFFSFIIALTLHCIHI